MVTSPYIIVGFGMEIDLACRGRVEDMEDTRYGCAGQAGGGEAVTSAHSLVKRGVDCEHLQAVSDRDFYPVALISLKDSIPAHY
jgi:hypothetical protein